MSIKKFDMENSAEDRTDSLDSAHDRLLAGQRSDNELGQELRKLAEEIARTRTLPPADSLSAEEANRLLHELQVHQIELEMQNEELRWTQDALQTARARYFDLYDLAPVAYVCMSEKALIDIANLTAARLLAVPRGALIKQPLSRFILPEDQDIYYLHRNKLLANSKPQACELRMVRPSGSAFWVRLEANLSADSETGSISIRTVLIDIDARKRAEIEQQTYLEKVEQMVKELTAE